MEYLGLSFTLKDQPFDQIRAVIEILSAHWGGKTGNVILVNGFMPRDVVLAKGFSTEVVDTLAEFFPYQINCFVNGAPQREQMAKIVREAGGLVYIIGEVRDGVKEEYEYYNSKAIHTSFLPLNFSGNFTNRPLTFGEEYVGLSFNPGGMQEVNRVKRLAANLIDELHDQRTGAGFFGTMDRKQHFYQESIDAVAVGSMQGVKAATWQYKN